MESIFSWLGQVLAYGGGGAAAAYLMFQYLGKKWIENKFEERLVLLRHTQAMELQRLRVEIDSLLSGAIRLQEKEFQALPEAWVKLDEAIGQVSNLVKPIQRYPDLNRLDNPQLEEFLESTRFKGTDKDRLRRASNKTAEYEELIHWYRLNDVSIAIADLHNYVERNSIFMPPELKKDFEKAANELWSAMISKEVGHDAKDWKMQNEGWEKVKSEVTPLRKTIEDAIYLRLQAHGKR